MKINSGELIKKIRKEMNLSQEDFARQLFISMRQLARIESGEVSMDVWQFISTLELLGHPTEDFWLLYLSSDEYKNYREYKSLKRQLRNGTLPERMDILANLEKGPLFKQSFIKQIVMFAKTALDETLSPDDALIELQNAMQMSKPDFDEARISECRMTYNEIYISLGMAQCLSALGEQNRAISLIQGIIKSREISNVSEEDRAALFPALYFLLSNMLKLAGRTKEALKACNDAYDISREYCNYKIIPEILLNIASCHHALKEEAQVCKVYLIRAYHCAYAMGQNETAAAIKNEAEKNFGIIIP